ncbi:MAG: hypothetical protein GIW94_08550 [Candidatus Eremiobacteraeota bacterium]|nr:hypothetical protein [Candidatus Eremiobacteraeota bacterium]MBC5821261.1 hypothetical protein [Candidatus Eremiobacteraeota bacterium]
MPNARTSALPLICILALVMLQAVSAFAVERAAIAYAQTPAATPQLAHIGYYLDPEYWGKATALVVLGCHFFEIVALYGLFRFLPANRVSNVTKAFIAGGVGLMLAASLSVRLTGLNSILYVYFAKVDAMATAYHVPPSFAPLPPGFTILRHVIPRILPSPYGPIWELFGRGLFAGTHSVAAAIFTLKAANAVALLAVFATLLLLRLPLQQASLFFLNPALYDNYIVSAHNDLFAILPILVALYLARRRAFAVAALLASVAGLVKLSLVVVALATVASVGRLRIRLASAALIIAVVVLGSLLLGGRPYLQAILFTEKFLSQQNGSHATRSIREALQAVLIAVGCIAVVNAVLWKRCLRSATWMFAGFSRLLHVWYFPWTIPFAVRFRVTTAALAITLPLFEIATNSQVANVIKVSLELPTLVFLAALGVSEFIRTKGRGEPSPLEAGDDQRQQAHPALAESA